MDANTLTIVVSLVALLIAAYAIYRSHAAGTPITGSLLTATLQESTPKAQEFTETALTGVRAAEQLYRTGKITRDKRFSEAATYFRRWFPDIDEDTLVRNVEAAVLVMNSVVDALPSKSDTPRAGLMGRE